MAQLQVVVVEAGTRLTKLAAALKTHHNFPYADCFLAAFAHAGKATLVISDKGFERVASFVKILWA